MRILVALDWSEKDAAVIAVAAALAREAQADVVLLNVYSPWVDPAFSAAATLEARVAEVETGRRAYLEARAADFPRLPVHVRVEPLRWPADQGSEEVAECIARVAGECGADILIVASKRAACVVGLLLGSVAQSLLRLSPCPVLVVRPDAVHLAAHDRRLDDSAANDRERTLLPHALGQQVHAETPSALQSWRAAVHPPDGPLPAR